MAKRTKQASQEAAPSVASFATCQDAINAVKTAFAAGVIEEDRATRAEAGLLLGTSGGVVMAALACGGYVWRPKNDREALVSALHYLAVSLENAEREAAPPAPSARSRARPRT